MYGVPRIRRELGSCWFLVLLVVVLCPFADAQRYHVRTYTESDGLPTSEIRSIAQGSDGTMWFGTRGGLVGFDGRTWRFHCIEGDGSRFDQAMLKVDRGGNLWMVSTVLPFLVSRYDGESWTRLPLSPLDGHQANVTGLIVSESEGKLRLIVSDSEGDLHFWDGESWQRNHVTHSLGGGSIRAMAAAGGRLLMATELGLLQLDLDELDGPPRPCPLSPPGPVYALAVEVPTHSLWVVGADWIGRVTCDGFVMDAAGLPLDSLHRSVSTSATVDALGGLYFGDVEKLFYYHPETGLEALNHGRGLVGAGASSLFMDRETNIWVASSAGLSKIVSRRFATFTREHGLLEDNVSSILERRNGGIVLGHNGGVTLLGDETRTLSFSQPLVRNRVLEIAEESDGTLWLAANHWGAIRIDPGGAWRSFGKEEGLRSSISGVLVDRDGTVWVGGSRGLYRLSGQVFESVKLSPDINLYVRRLIQTRDGAIYGTTCHHGVFSLRNGKLESWFRGSSAAEDSCFSLFEDVEGTIWVATHGGPRILRDGQILPPEDQRTELEQPVYFVLRDAQGDLWFGTSKGVYRQEEELLEQINPVRGLAGNETSRAAGIVDRHGRVWIGTDRGVSRYSRTFDLRARIPPELALVDIEAGGISFAPDESFVVPSRSNVLAVRFRVVSFDDERRVSFRVKMEGFDDGWSDFEPLSQWVIRYRGLPRGTYRFKIQAIDVEGQVSEIVTSSQFKVQGPLWVRPWFLAVLLMVVFFLASGIAAIVLQRRNAQVLEREVSLRTEQLRVSEQSLRAGQERLATILESLREGVAVTDERGLVRSFNPSAERITAWTRDEALGTSIEDILGCGWRDTSGSTEVAGEIPGGILQRQARLRGGRERWVEASIAPLKGDGSSGASFVWVLRDVTERRQVEEETLQAQKLESLGVLAGGIAHDFNNLLTVLMGNLGLLEDLVTLEQPFDRLIPESLDASRRAQLLTRQLLTFSKGGAPVREVLKIASLIREVASLCYSGSNVMCALDLEEGLWSVMADPGQIEQVLSNLLINAWQSMPDGGTVRVVARNVPPAEDDSSSGRMVSVEVRDEGVGIPEKDLGRVFDPYFTTKQKGHGLGLAIVYSVVRKHEGHLELKSVPGEGSVFRVVLPATEEIMVGDNPKTDTVIRREGRILIMDDEDQIRSIIRKVLVRSGLKVYETSDGKEAVRAYREAMGGPERFDMVLLDMTIPGGMGGLEAVQQLRKIDPDVRAVVISGYSDDPVLAEPQQHGFVAALAKPFQQERLLSLISQLLGFE